METAGLDDLVEIYPGNTEFGWTDKSFQILAGQEDGSVKWKTITAVTRHPVEGGRVLRVTLRSGRVIEGTKGESFVRLIGDSLVPSHGTDLVVGDTIAVSKSLLHESEVRYATDDGLLLEKD
jgi:intein/homing endonuclease